MTYNLTGFNGQRRDPVSGYSHSGNGYRAYNPVLMRFNCPDDMSPFGPGGINPYAFCDGDPVNRADPSGHFSLGQGIGMALGLVAGFALSVLTEGAAMPAVLTLMATAAGSAAIGAGTELATEAIDGQRINWGQVGIAAGISAAASLVGLGLAGRSRSVSGGLLRTTWSWKNTRNIGILCPSYRDGMPEAIYFFEDIHKGQMRLSIVGHANFLREEGTASVAVSEDMVYTGYDIVRELEHYIGYDFDRVTHIRTIMCHSAEGGMNSLAAQVASATGLPTTGYLGKVTTTGILDDYADDYFQLALTEHPGSSFPENFTPVRLRADNLINHTYSYHMPQQVNMNGDAMFRVIRNDIRYNYEPRTFIPVVDENNTITGLRFRQRSWP